MSLLTIKKLAEFSHKISVSFEKLKFSAENFAVRSCLKMVPINQMLFVAVKTFIVTVMLSAWLFLVLALLIDSKFDERFKFLILLVVILITGEFKSISTYS